MSYSIGGLGLRAPPRCAATREDGRHRASSDALRNPHATGPRVRRDFSAAKASRVAYSDTAGSGSSGPAMRKSWTFDSRHSRGSAVFWLSTSPPGEGQRCSLGPSPYSVGRNGDSADVTATAWAGPRMRLLALSTSAHADPGAVASTPEPQRGAAGRQGLREGRDPTGDPIQSSSCALVALPLRKKPLPL